MSIPSFDNIDQWLFEFTEGNLSPTQESQLIDFLEENPEMMRELKAWQQAKITPNTSLAFSSDSLLKTTPFFSRTTSIIVIGAMVLLFSWIGFLYFPTAIQYSKTQIDTEIIKVKRSNHLIDAIPTKPILITTRNRHKKERNTSQENTIQKENIKSANISRQTEQQSPDLSLLKVLPLSEQNISNNLALNSPIKTTISGFNINQNSHTDLEINTSSDYKTRSLSQVKAYGLDEVISFIDNKKQKVTQNKNDISNSRFSVGSETSKTTLKKSINNSVRKIKRMVNQPLALRNTVNPYYHAPMMTGFAVNPAMVGTAQGSRIQATSRMQWLNNSNSQLINSLSWDGYMYALRGGLGLDVNFSDYNSQTLNDFSARVVYSPKFSIDNNTSFEPSISFKMGVINIDKNAELLGSKIEVNRNNIVSFFENESTITGSQLWYRDVGLGFILNTKYYYLGFNADNIGRHNNNFYSGDLSKEYREDIYYTAVAGTEYQLTTRDIVINGYGLFQSYGDLNEIWVGGNLQFKWLHFGAGISTRIDGGASLGVDFNRFALHYNIDYTKSKLLDEKFLSHQVTMKLLIKQVRQAPKFLSL